MNEEQIEEQLERGWSLLEGGSLDRARGLAETVRSAAPESADAVLLLAACAREAGEDDAAIKHLREAARLDPEWATPELWLAEVLGDHETKTDEAWKHARRALELAEEEDEFLDAMLLKARLELDLGKDDAARETLSELPPADVELPAPLVLHMSELLLEAGEAEEARARLEAVTEREPDDADAWHALGYAHDALGDEEAKRKAWRQVRALDLAAPELEDALDDDEVASVAEAALSELPAKARKLLENVPILIADFPAEEDVAAGLDPRLLGLFAGTPYPEASNVGGQPALTNILLFRRNLERVALDDEMLRDEIRTTLLHETGHFFGMDEEDLARVGLD